MIFARPLTWDEWILWVIENEPARVFDEAERARFVAEYWSAHPLLDGQQWRRGRAQGLLDPVSPLKAQRGYK